jgi:Zn-finger nucleic acid-binding protein
VTVTDLATSAETRACPSCTQPMARRSFEAKLQAALDLDICFACSAIWFDPFESAQLTPGAIIELFRIINQPRDGPPRPLSDASRCPVCKLNLQLTHDIERTNRIVYYRCPSGHGRLTTFFMFLREKNFVRSLSPAEIERLRRSVKQVRCSSCGAPIDVEHDAQCGYCHAPIAILDPDAVAKALATLSDEERKRTQVSPTASIDAMLAAQRFDRQLAQLEQYPHGRSDAFLVDLVGTALGAFLEKL